MNRIGKHQVSQNGFTLLEIIVTLIMIGITAAIMFPAMGTNLIKSPEPIDRLNIPGTNDPIERLAWRWLRYWTHWYDKARKRPGSEPYVERLIQYIEDYQIDGIVMHEAFSCRTWHLV